MLVLRTSNFHHQGTTIRPIVPRREPVNHSKIILTDYFHLFFDESRESQMKTLKNKKNKTHLILFKLFIFCKSASVDLLTEKFSQISTILTGIFLGRELFC